jgi:hypothetical protein
MLPDDPPNTDTRKSKDGHQRDTLEWWESFSRIFAAIGIPVVLAVGGWLIQTTLAKQSVSKDYVTLALDILENKQGNDEARNTRGLRTWAVDLLNDASPVKMDSYTADQLINRKMQLLEFRETLVPLP